MLTIALASSACGSNLASCRAPLPGCPATASSRCNKHTRCQFPAAQLSTAEPQRLLLLLPVLPAAAALQGMQPRRGTWQQPAPGPTG